VCNLHLPESRPDRTVSIYFFAGHFFLIRGNDSSCHPHSFRTTTNRLEEDQAPCLLVLTRTDLSLHNLKLTISKGRSSDFLRPLIDQEYEKEDTVQFRSIRHPCNTVTRLTKFSFRHVALEAVTGSKFRQVWLYGWKF